MKHTARALFLGTLLVGAFGLGTLWSQDAGQGAEDPMAQWIKFTSPNENHARLEFLAGEWDVAGKFYTVPGQPPAENKGTCTRTWILGKRWLDQRFSSDFMGTPYEGFGLDGWDPLKQRYVSLWTDTMGAGFYVSEGKWDAASSTLKLQGEWPDPMTGPGATSKVRMELKQNANGSVVMKMFETKKDSPERLTMEMTYTRKAQ